MKSEIINKSDNKKPFWRIFPLSLQHLMATLGIITVKEPNKNIDYPAYVASMLRQMLKRSTSLKRKQFMQLQIEQAEKQLEPELREIHFHMIHFVLSQYILGYSRGKNIDNEKEQEEFRLLYIEAKKKYDVAHLFRGKHRNTSVFFEDKEIELTVEKYLS